jgi:hypothetical protein
MLRKLVKHDILSTYRDFALIYMGMLAFSILSGYTISIDTSGSGVYSRISFILLMGSVISAFVLTLVTIIRLFSKRLFSNEGYLTLTLPVTNTQTVIAKVISGLFWVLLTSLVFLVSFGIMLTAIWFSIGNRMLLEGYTWASFWQMFEGIGLVRMIQAGLLLATPLSFLEIVYSLLILLFVIVLINTSYIKKFKMPLGIGVYLLISLALDTLKNYLIASPVIMNNWVIDGIVQPEVIAEMLQSGKPLELIVNWWQYGGLVLFYLAFIGAFGYLSVRLLNKKLELE